jgi:SAM-dependent methyltransferase
VLVPLGPPALLRRAVLGEPFVAVLPAAHPLAAQRTVRLPQLADSPFVLLPRAVGPSPHDQIIGLCTAAGFTPQVVQHAVEWQTVCALVETGLGVSLAPASIGRIRLKGSRSAGSSPAPPVPEWPSPGARTTTIPWSHACWRPSATPHEGRGKRRGRNRGAGDVVGPSIMIRMTNIRYDEVIGPLRAAYDARAAWRDGLAKEPWKLAERQAFRDRLAPGARVLEIGAGTGQDSAYFQDEGFDVVAADLSPAMVEHCRAKGIEAHVMDFLHLDVPVGSFDAVFAMNCLLHVPNHDLPAVLVAIRAALRPGGLLFIGVYGGDESAEGPIPGDEHVPPRFFSWRTDEQLLGFATAGFEVADFHSVTVGQGHRFQSLTLRRPNGE